MSNFLNKLVRGDERQRSVKFFGYPIYDDKTGDNETEIKLRQQYLSVKSALEDKSQLFQMIKELDKSWITHTILMTLSEDVFHKFLPPNSEPFTIQTSDEEDQEIIREYLERYKVIDVIKEVFPIFALLGEYLFVLDTDNEQIDDYVPQDSWVLITERGGSRKIVVNPDAVVVAMIDGQYKSILMRDLIKSIKGKALIIQYGTSASLTGYISRSLYTYKLIRGKPLLNYATMKLIRSIAILENMIPLTSVLSTDSQFLIYLRFPAQSNLANSLRQAEDYQEYLNRFVNKLKIGDPDEVVREALKFTVVPVFGEKGAMDPQQLPKPEPPRLDDVRELKRSLSSATGFPPSLLGIPDEDTKQMQSRYLMMVYSYRIAIANFIQMFLDKILSNKVSNFSVVPVKPLGLDDLILSDTLEMTSLGIQSFGEVIEKMKSVVDGSKDFVNTDILIKNFNEKFRGIFGEDVIKQEEFDDNFEGSI